MVIRSFVTVHLVYLWLHFFPLPVLTHVSGVDLVVEVADVTDNGAVLQLLKHVLVAHVHVTRGRYDQVGFAQQVCIDAFQRTVIFAVDVRRHDFEAVHARLHSTDRIDLSDFNDHAFLTQRRGRTFTHVTVTDHQCFLTRQQVVSTALDGIVQRVATAVLVVVLRFCDRIVHVDGGYFQFAFFQHFQQAVNTRGCLFRDAVDVVQQCWEVVVNHLSQVTTIVQNHVGIPDLVAVFFGKNGLFDAPQEFFFSLTFPGEDRDTSSSDGSSGVILSRENIA